ncbi:MAG: hypothetical protein ABSG00_06880 [Terracidiphilus sp.]|jgi:hypothetical protein
MIRSKSALEMHQGEAVNDSARLGLTTKELPNELEFCFAREQSGTMQIVAIVLALVSAIAAFIPASLRPEAFWIFATVSAAFLGWALWMAADTARNWKRVYKTTLTATAQRIEATGDNLKPDWMGHYTRPGTVVLPVSEVKMLSYSPGDGQYKPSGLCVNSRIVMGAIRMQGKCILPGLNREQATAVIVAITRRFPEIGSQLQQER